MKGRDDSGLKWYFMLYYGAKPLSKRRGISIPVCKDKTHLTCLLKPHQTQQILPRQICSCHCVSIGKLTTW